MFRSIPSKEFCDGVLKLMGIHGFTDTKLFLASDIKVNEEWICLLEDYYLPCKWNKLTPITQMKTKTIIKNILRIYGHDLDVIQKKNNGRCAFYYRIKQPPRPFKEEDFIVHFD